MEKEKKFIISAANRFHIHRARIADISRRDGCGFDVAAEKLAMAMAWTNYADELREFRLYISQQKSNLVLKYFGG